MAEKQIRCQIYRITLTPWRILQMKSAPKTVLSLFVLFVMLCSLLALNAQDAKQNPAKSGAPKSESKGSKWGDAPSAEFAPQRVILGWTGDPAHTQAVTWRTAKLAERSEERR